MDRGLGILFSQSAMQIFAEFESHEALVREFDDNLGKARAFVVGEYDVHEREEVELVLIHPSSGEWLPLRAEVVYIAPPAAPAIGLEILEFNGERSDLIRAFIFEPSDSPALSLMSPESVDRERVELVEATPHVKMPTVSSVPRDTHSLGPLELSQPGGAGPDGITEEPPESDAVWSGSEVEASDEKVDAEVEPESVPPSSVSTSRSVPPSRGSVPPPRNVQERVRKLNVRERDAMARGGTLTERVALERAYGAAVWDGLLSNAALTGPEVARIAKNGNATIPHLTLIVGNPAWLAKGEVRRALLTNPRLTPPQIEKVLRALPPTELKQLPKQTAYAPKVRAVALRMLSR